MSHIIKKIHSLSFSWSRDQAIDYVLQHSGWQKSEVENEIDRYITWPGQVDFLLFLFYFFKLIIMQVNYQKFFVSTIRT